MDTNEKVSLIIQFSLLIAGEEEDYRDRDLRPIHLIKYVYLADLEFAKSHDGKSFTGIDWQFYDFGPYSNDVYLQVDPAVNSIYAEKKIFPSDYQDNKDWCCYNIVDDTLLDEIDSKLPITITATLQRHIRNFTNSTPELLNYVYNTAPMRNAAPLEMLDFSYAVEPAIESTEKFVPFVETLSKKKQLAKKRRMLELKAKFSGISKTKKPWRETLVKPPHEPRHDEVFEDGVKWLDSLSGEPLKEGEVEVTFADSVWKSPTRSMNGSF